LKIELNSNRVLSDQLKGIAHEIHNHYALKESKQVKQQKGGNDVSCFRKEASQKNVSFLVYLVGHIPKNVIIGIDEPFVKIYEH